MTSYRSLTEKEIATLTVYGCSAESWQNVVVAEDFSPAYISDVHFSGNVHLGTSLSNCGGLKKTCRVEQLHTAQLHYRQ